MQQIEFIQSLALIQTVCLIHRMADFAVVIVVY
jgi:hypothetical protein